MSTIKRKIENKAKTAKEAIAHPIHKGGKDAARDDQHNLRRPTPGWVELKSTLTSQSNVSWRSIWNLTAETAKSVGKAGGPFGSPIEVAAEAATIFGRVVAEANEAPAEFEEVVMNARVLLSILAQAQKDATTNATIQFQDSIRQMKIFFEKCNDTAKDVQTQGWVVKVIHGVGEDYTKDIDKLNKRFAQLENQLTLALLGQILHEKKQAFPWGLVGIGMNIICLIVFLIVSLFRPSR